MIPVKRNASIKVKTKAGTPAVPARKTAGSVVKSMAPLAFMAALALVLAALAFLFLPYVLPASTESRAQEGGWQPACIDGQTRPCTAAGCNGTSTCMNGRWWGCKWNQTCVPGSRAPCLRDTGCTYAVKECNSCGTGYSECFGG